MIQSQQNLITRLWEKDLSLWSGASAGTDSIANRLGWLDAVEWMDKHIGALNSWAQQTVGSGRFDTVILLGMGGSSLAAEVFSAVFGGQSASQACPQLRVVDTTSPAQINALDVNFARSLIIVSSKSGSTVETADLLAYFHARLGEHTDHPGNHLVAITDPDSQLHQQAIEMKFTRVFLNPADIGGRYSALSYFGLVPAALIGVDLHQLLAQTRVFSDHNRGDDADNPANPVQQLAQLMGAGSLSGGHILQLHLAPPLQSLAVWIEQLVAESLGKEAKGILPTYDDLGDDLSDDLGDGSEAMPNQRNISSVYIGLGDEKTPVKTGITTDMRWQLGNRYDIGGEFLRWEMATALAASIMDVNPFDQPDVEQAKQQTRLFITGQQSQPFSKLFATQHYTVYTNTIARSDNIETMAAVFDQFGEISTDALYLAVLAYLPNFTEVNGRLQTLRRQFAQRFVLTTTLGYGPRYLHSTGQFHKGGPASGCFIQITEQSMEEIEIPGKQYGFSELHDAQADGDYSVLEKKGLPLMRITLKGDRLEALDKLLQDI